MDWIDMFNSFLSVNESAFLEALKPEALGAAFYNFTEDVIVFFAPVTKLLFVHPKSGIFAMTWAMLSFAMFLAARYGTRIARAWRVRSYAGVTWNILMLLMTTPLFAYCTIISVSHKLNGPIEWGVFALALALSVLLFAIAIVSSRIYGRKNINNSGEPSVAWKERETHVLMTPAFVSWIYMFLLVAPGALFMYFFIMAVIFGIAYLVFSRQSYRDASMFRNYMIDRSRDYYERKARRR